LKELSKKSKFYQLVLTYLSYRFSDNKLLNELNQLYNKLDKNTDYKITKAELYKAYKETKIPITAKDIDDIINSMDFNSNGDIDYEEFIRMCIPKEKLFTEENLKSAFLMFDKEKKGFITPQKIIDFIESTKHISENLKAQITNEIIDLADEIIDYEDFRDFFIETLYKELGDAKAKFILDQVDWVKWIEAPGKPPLDNDFSNKYATEVDNAVENFYNNTLPNNFKETFTKWHTLLKQYFLRTIRATDKELDNTQLNLLSNELNLKEGYNAEINFEYFMNVLIHGKIIEDDVKEALIAFLGKFGRMKYLRPLYTAFYKRDKELSRSTFEKYKSSYHPIAQRLIVLDFRNLD